MLTPEKSQNPYLDARREWNERYGDYISTAYQWRLTAIIALVTSLIAVSGTVYLASQNHLIPYVVAVDELGQAVAVQQATPMTHADPRVIKAQLARFIVNIRSVMVDVNAQKRALNEAYAFLTPQAAASKVVIDFLEKNPPIERAANETVSVTILSVLPISEKTWQIEFEELARGRNGVEISLTRYKAAATVVFHLVEDEATLLKNPIGLYLEELNWTRQF